MSHALGDLRSPSTGDRGALGRGGQLLDVSKRRTDRRERIRALAEGLSEIFKPWGHPQAILTYMKTDNLAVNELSDDAFDWYLEYLTALDAKDIDAYAQFLAPEVELIMNNADPVSGRDTVTAGLSQYWQSFGDLEHEPLRILGSDHAFVLEALNHYSTLDGRSVTLRAVAFTDRRDDGLVTSVRLYTDAAPLSSPG